MPGSFKQFDQYPNRKLILTGANDKQFKKFGLDSMPYEVFTFKHEPEKTDPEYYRRMLAHFRLDPKDAVYFEHNKEAAESAQSVGVATYHYDNTEQNLGKLKAFLDRHIFKQ